MRNSTDAAPRATRDATVRADGVVRIYAPTWMRDETLSGAAPHLQDTWIVFADAGPLASAVADALRIAGAAPIFAEAGDCYRQLSNAHFRIRPAEPDDISALVRDVGHSIGPVQGAILLWDVTSGVTAGTASPTRGYGALVALAAGLGAWDEGAPMRVLAVSAGVHSVFGEPVSSPEAATLLGPVRPADGGTRTSDPQR